MTPPTVNVLFVCLGNICRSPTAHGVFQALVDARNLGAAIGVDSAGTGAWHIGNPPDRRATFAARRRGYDLSPLRARQASAADFLAFDYILAMDRDNLRVLESMKPSTYAGELDLLLRYCGEPDLLDVPDPYYGGGDGFEHVLDLVEAAGAALLDRIVERHRL